MSDIKGSGQDTGRHQVLVAAVHVGILSLTPENFNYVGDWAFEQMDELGRCWLKHRFDGIYLCIPTERLDDDDHDGDGDGAKPSDNDNNDSNIILFPTWKIKDRRTKT